MLHEQVEQVEQDWREASESERWTMFKWLLDKLKEIESEIEIIGDWEKEITRIQSSLDHAEERIELIHNLSKP